MAQTLIEWTWRRVSVASLTLSQLQFALDIGAVIDGPEIILPGFTFNPWIGCTKVSPGCLHCYAAELDLRRFSKTLGEATKEAPIVHWGKGAPRWRTSEANWRKPLQWNRQAQELGVRLRVFSASLADWLDDEVPVAWLADFCALMAATPHLDWLLVTKRPENWGSRLSQVRDGEDFNPCARAFAAAWLGGAVWQNVWFIVSTEDQARADERVPILLEIPAAVRGLSCEPLLGPVDLTMFTAGCGIREDKSTYRINGINWVIVGGESGSDQATPAGDVFSAIRPMHPAWARSLREQCAAAGVPFFFKQWGEWVPLFDSTASPEHVFPDGERVFRVGKSSAGKLLDGREHHETPNIEVAA